MATRVLPSPVFISAILPWWSTHAADHLDVEVAHADHALAGLADDRESLRQQSVERGSFRVAELIGRLLRVDTLDRLGDAGLELGCFTLELLVI